MKKIRLFICLGICTINSFAQTSGGAITSFSLKQAIDYAFQNQNTIKNAILDQEIAKQNKISEILCFVVKKRSKLA